VADITDPRAVIRAKALEVGFDAVGFAPAELGGDVADSLRKFLARGYHGEMAWMPEKADRRIGPTALWPEAKSVIALGMNYTPAEDPLALAGKADRGVISVYARNRDYHDTVKKRLKALGRWIVESQGCEIKVFVDTAPVMEKPLAARAGIGWQGKHTNLVSREHGSWLFLGEIYTTLEIDPDAAEEDHCGTCRDCLDACPTNAFPAPRQIDARRCISYLTIEHKGPIPEELRPLMGNRIYGCDDCLAVCPWNKFAKATTEPAFLPRAELTAPRLADLAQLDDAGFRQLFAGSPIKRIGSARFIRNVLIALGNSGDPAQAPVAEALTGDDYPVVRDAAAWAVGRLTAASS
jgi:epoxyqueuosine reductase